MKRIKLFKPEVNWSAIWRVVRVLRSGQLAEGPQVKAFEAELAERFGLTDVVSLSSGTAALELAYELAGIGHGDEVISPVLTAVMTNLPLVHRGARIVFADAEDDLNMSVEDVRRKLTPNTKAIVFVHYNGNNRGLDELIALAKERNIPLIEDAAQAIGSDNWGKGDFVCLSFQAIKTFTTGDGGALICKDPELSKKARRLRWFGLDRENRHTADITEAGYKYHMNDIAAAIGRGNLESLDKVIEHRKRLIDAYRAHGIQAYIWRAFILANRREELQARLKEAGIDSAVYDGRNDVHTVFGGRQKLPNMDRLESQYLLLPLHTGVSMADVQRIAAIAKDFHAV
jgi:dTDP-4-amino-4,6-dideoxygalactose transaminase